MFKSLYLVIFMFGLVLNIFLVIFRNFLIIFSSKIFKNFREDYYVLIYYLEINKEY